MEIGAGTLAGHVRNPVDQLIGAERTAFTGKNLKNTPPAWGEAYFVAAAQRQRGGQRVLGARLLRLARRGKLFPGGVSRETFMWTSYSSCMPKATFHRRAVVAWRRSNWRGA